MSNNKFKVLVVEDEANICSFIETLLETNGYQALVAHTCTMGLTLFSSHNPDLVILDLGLPDRDGLELIRTVRQKYMTPIIVLSARTDEMDKIEALAIRPEEQTMFICHADCEVEARAVAEEMKARYGVKEVYINYIGPVIGSHTGPNTMGIFFVGTQR